MGDERRVGVPDWWTAADEDDTSSKSVKCGLGVHARAHNEKLPVHACELRNARDCPRPGKQDMSSRDLEKPRNVGLVLRRLVAFPWHSALKAKLSGTANGTNYPDDSVLHGIRRVSDKYAGT